MTNNRTRKKQHSTATVIIIYFHTIGRDPIRNILSNSMNLKTIKINYTYLNFHFLHIKLMKRVFPDIRN
jgi:hypothetical protein